MAGENTFYLEIITPERQFYIGPAEALVLPAVDGQIPGSQEDGGAVFHVPADAPSVTVVNFQNGVGGGVAKGDLTRKKIVEGEADAREELPDLHEALA